MFTTINKLAAVRPSRLQRLRETIIASAGGIAVTAAVFQAIYFTIFVLE